MAKKLVAKVLPPWDLLRGKDVFLDSVSLSRDLVESSVSHWAPNCSTFSRARERPIAGAVNPPKPLRSSFEPSGVADVLDTLPPSKKRKLELDTDMANMAAESCFEADVQGKRFSLEHPLNSIARDLPSWKRLENREGVFKTEYHACMFAPCRRKKAQVLIHNTPELQVELNRLCTGKEICDRTGRPHEKWAPRVVNGRVVSFATGEEREYPKEFCSAYAKGLWKAMNQEDMTFLEVFSGPNAPLSCGVAEAFGVEVPPPVQVMRGSKAVFTECRGLNELTGEKGSIPPHPNLEYTSPKKGQGMTLGETSYRKCLASFSESFREEEVEKGKYRLEAVQAGKQPSYGGRTQLIPDGLQDPLKHLELAKTLSHPFYGASALKRDHEKSMEVILSTDPSEIVARRVKRIEDLKAIVAECEPAQIRENGRAAWTSKKLGLKAKTAAMRRLQDSLDIEDKHVPEACLEGLRILGPASQSEFFEPFECTPTMSEKEFYSGLRERSEEMVKRVEKMAKLGGKELSVAIWEKTQKEVEKGTMGRPLSLSELRQEYGDDFQVVPSFGLAQGLDEKGHKKFRRIDDHTASGANRVALRKQKVPMTMIDYVAVLVRELAARGVEDINLASDDMKSAYRQIPLSPRDVRYAITGVWNPHREEVELYHMHGQPFGAGHAVPNFCRVAEWISRVIIRLFEVICDHFFDDFFIIEPAALIDTAVFCLQSTFSSLGFSLDEDKNQPPAATLALLGVYLNTSTLKSQRLLLVEPKPSRKQNLCLQIDQILQQGSLTPTEAASLVGKFGFLCSTLFGKVGRCCTGAVRSRQYSNSSFKGLTQELKTSLRLMKQFVSMCPSREINIDKEDPLLIYTDASDVPGRSPQHIVGAVLFDPKDKSLEFSSLAVEPEILALWLPKQNHMSQLELLAAPFAISTWKSKCSNRSILLFVDNNGAAANLVKGYSAQVDSAAIVGHFWLLAASLKLSVYIDRVESKSNIADGPSREEFELLKSLGARWISPVSNQLVTPSIHPSAWFGAD